MAISTISQAGLDASIALTTPIITTTLGVGNATPAASGAGITFPATQSASSDVNTLDDYEEGTWTPTITAEVGTPTTVSGSGSYIKIGRVVTVNFTITCTTVGTAAGDIIATLPFVRGSDSIYYVGVGVYAAGLTFHVINSGSTTMAIRDLTNTTIWASGRTYSGSFTYFASA